MADDHNHHHQDHRHHLPPDPPEEQTQQQQPPPQTRIMSQDHKKKKNMLASSYRSLCTCLSVLLLLLGVTALVLWLVYRPHRPRFTVAGAAVYGLNATPPLISATMQFTLVTRNPNRRVSIYYDRLYAFVSYRNQAITPQVELLPLYHDRRSTVVLSPVLGGVAVPVSAEVVNGLLMDEGYGVVGLRVAVVGRLRWKAAGINIKSGHYGVYVKCDVLVGLKKGVVGQVPLLGNPSCKVDI